MNGFQLASPIQRIDKRRKSWVFIVPALSPENRQRIEQYEGIGATESAWRRLAVSSLYL